MKMAVRGIAGLVLGLLFAAILPFGGAAEAAPVTPDLGSTIDPYQPYDPTEGTGCSATITPGILAIRDVISAAYPSFTSFDILRTCTTAGHSGHEEGRAIDWMINAKDPAQEALAQSFLTWLQATDQYGNPNAMARRLGIMYVIHNNWAWRAYDLTNHANPSPDPHTDHIHISLAWPGAHAETSYYTGGYGCQPNSVGCPVIRLAGPDRYSTAVAIAQSAFPASSSVLIASGDQAHLVDGLVGAPLAAVKHAPLLLTPIAALPGTVVAEIQRRGATTAYVLGGEASVSATVVQQLAAAGIRNVIRFAGIDRYATAAAIAAEVGAPNGVAFVASGSNRELSSALIAGGPAAALNAPVLLTRGDVLSPPTAAVIRALGITKTFAVGSTGSLMAAVTGALPSVTKVEAVGVYATSVALATAMIGRVSLTHVVLASGGVLNTVDGMPGGTFGRIILLTTPTTLSVEVRSWLRAHPEVQDVTVLGGVGAVTDFAARMAALSVTVTP